MAFLAGILRSARAAPRRRRSLSPRSGPAAGRAASTPKVYYTRRIDNALAFPELFLTEREDDSFTKPGSGRYGRSMKTNNVVFVRVQVRVHCASQVTASVRAASPTPTASANGASAAPTAASDTRSTLQPPARARAHTRGRAASARAGIAPRSAACRRPPRRSSLGRAPGTWCLSMARRACCCRALPFAACRAPAASI